VRVCASQNAQLRVEPATQPLQLGAAWTAGAVPRALHGRGASVKLLVRRAPAAGADEQHSYKRDDDPEHNRRDDNGRRKRAPVPSSGNRPPEGHQVAYRPISRGALVTRAIAHPTL
jgi:hypothetical protein